MNVRVQVNLRARERNEAKIILKKCNQTLPEFSNNLFS